MLSRAGSLVALLLLAGCSASSPTPSPPLNPTLGPSRVASSTKSLPAPTSTAAPTAVSARVTFDGADCSYTGPVVIPFPADLTFDYAPTAAEADSWIGIIAVKSGTTVTDLEDPSLPPAGEGVPPFAFGDTHMFYNGGGREHYRAVPSGLNPLADMLLDGQPYDTFIVFCLNEMPGRPVGGFTFLRVVDNRPTPAPTTSR